MGAFRCILVSVVICVALQCGAGHARGGSVENDDAQTFVDFELAFDVYRPLFTYALRLSVMFATPGRIDSQ